RSTSIGLPSGALPPPPLPFFLVGFFSNNFTILPNRSPQSLLDVTTFQRLIQRGEHLAARMGNQDIILDSHAAFTGEINSRLDGDDHSRPQLFLAAGLSHDRQLVNFAPNAMAEPMAELLAKAGFLDH